TIHQVNHKTAHKHNRWRHPFYQHQVQTHRPVGHVSYFVLVEVIAVVFVPVVVLKQVHGRAAVGAHIKGVAGKVVETESILNAARQQAYGPAIAVKIVAGDVEPAGAFHVNAGGVSAEGIV